MSKPGQLSMWKSVLNEHLGPRWRKYHTHIAVTLDCVNNGLKPAFLWDVGPLVEPEQLSSVVQVLKTRELLSGDVRVVTVGGDTLIVNVETLTETLGEFKSGRRVFVDVTGGSAVLVEGGSVADDKCGVMLRGLLGWIGGSGVDGDWCVPSVFGVMSGYPVVYWYDPSVCRAPACLDGAPLLVYKLHAGDVELYSFSVPAAIGATLRRLVDDWSGRVAGGLRGCGLASTFSERTVAVERVAM